MLPFLNPTNKKSKKYAVAFRGLNYGEGYTDGEFSETKNISLDEFPCLTQRYGRTEHTFDGKVTEYSSPSAVFAKGGLLVIDGTRVMYEGEDIGLTVERGRQQIVSIGNYIVIFPDKKYYNVVTKDYGSMEETITAQATFTDSTIEITGATFNFKKGDGVEISGSSLAENNQTIIVRGVDGNKLTFYENSFTAKPEAEMITISRSVPNLEYVCESNYRLWGVKGNTIYASKYMDPFNFQFFDNSSADSYNIDVATDGVFTGCIPYSSHICFFKENTLHKLYGSKPSNFQLITSQVYGVESGSERSMCIINETLFYKGVNGIYAYTGGIPDLVSEKFGTKRFRGGVAATDGERYYISLTGDEFGLYVFDVAKNIWTREDSLRCADMTFHNGSVYMLCRTQAEEPYQKLLKIDSEADRSDIEWSVTFCPFNETINERKGYSKFHMRLDLSAGAWLQVEIKRNTDTKWQTVYTTHNERDKTITVPILPARCDSVEIRLSGKGVCKLRTFIREFYVGSDV